MSVKARKAIADIPSYKPAKTVKAAQEESGIKTIVKLAGNENNLGCSPNVAKALTNAFPELSRYPEFSNAELAGRIASKYGVDRSELIFTNGSFELISVVALAYLNPGEESVIPDPSFGWYRNVTKQAGAKEVIVPLKDDYVDIYAMLDAVTENTKLLWICNPNNPTGTGYTHSEIEEFLKKVPQHVLVVLDEAYIDFWNGEDRVDAGKLIHTYNNVIALRTFSKLHGLASLRIGYGLANQEIISNLRKAKVPIDITMAGQVAAVAAFDDEEFQRKVIENNKKGLELYYRTLEDLGLKYIPSNGNFIMFDTGTDSGWVVSEYLKRGYVIRDGKDFGRPGWLRVTIGKPEENEKVLEILRELL